MKYSFRIILILQAYQRGWLHSTKGAEMVKGTNKWSISAKGVVSSNWRCSYGLTNILKYFSMAFIGNMIHARWFMYRNC